MLVLPVGDFGAGPYRVRSETQFPEACHVELSKARVAARDWRFPHVLFKPDNVSMAVCLILLCFCVLVVGWRKHRSTWVAPLLLAGLLVGPAQASLTADMLRGLASDDSDEVVAAVDGLGALATPEAFAVLKSIQDENLYYTPKGRVLIVENDQARDPLTGETLVVPDEMESVTVNNRMRNALNAALAGSRIFAAERAERLDAAGLIQKNPRAAQRPLIARALGQESDAQIRNLLEMALATIDLKSTDTRERRLAVETLGASTTSSVRPLLMEVLARNTDGQYVEPEAAVREAAVASLQQFDRRMQRIEWAGHAFYGLSLASVLLLAALGLAITFGLMGIINMAHGELLMIGAYVTYVVQTLFRRYWPEQLDWYVIAALPVAFAVTALVGMLLERLVIRWLYGRPLETLLATWGISLMLMQTVRMIFGAQNVEVANPAWMSGGVTVLGGLVLTYNRLVIIVFAFLVVGLVWMLLNRTRLGLFVRAVTQNRRMADCVGVPTGRVDMLTFGLGSGIAGLGGVALSQLGNVGPDLGQAYIVDSFMVVVLGGVGQLAGTVIAALGLGQFNKFLEPYAGAVMAKICILVLIVLVIQKRPQGLFALKGRSVD